MRTPCSRLLPVSLALAGAAASWLPSPAHSQLSGSVSIESDYRFRGVSLSGSKPSVRASANLDSAMGWYAGASITTASLSQGERYAQLLGYAGYVTPLAAGRAYELGANYSVFPGNSQYDYAEAYAGLLAPGWSVRLNYSPSYFGRHIQTLYLDASGHIPIGDNLRLLGHAGVLAPLAGAYDPRDPRARHARADVRAGVGRAFGDIDVQLAWTAASSGGPFPAVYTGRPNTVQLSAMYSF